MRTEASAVVDSTIADISTSPRNTRTMVLTFMAPSLRGIAGHTMPAGALGDLFHFARVGRDAERDVRGAEAASLPGLPDKAAALLAGGLQFGPGRVDLNPGALVVPPP
jgi:hypothetical protein